MFLDSRAETVAISLLYPFFRSIEKMIALRVDHIVGPAAFPWRTPCASFIHLSNSSPPYVKAVMDRVLDFSEHGEYGCSRNNWSRNN